jgi:hypothetical protein
MMFYFLKLKSLNGRLFNAQFFEVLAAGFDLDGGYLWRIGGSKFPRAFPTYFTAHPAMAFSAHVGPGI